MNEYLWVEVPREQGPYEALTGIVRDGSIPALIGRRILFNGDWSKLLNNGSYMQRVWIEDVIAVESELMDNDVVTILDERQPQDPSLPYRMKLQFMIPADVF